MMFTMIWVILATMTWLVLCLVVATSSRTPEDVERDVPSLTKVLQLIEVKAMLFSNFYFF